jgi:hypothetical protein
MSDALCPSHGTKTGTSCVFTRKLCVACSPVNGGVWISTQTNNMPSHCPFSPTVQPVEKQVDYVALWLRSSSFTNTYANVTTQDEVDSLVCDVSSSHSDNINYRS